MVAEAHEVDTFRKFLGPDTGFGHGGTAPVKTSMANQSSNHVDPPQKMLDSKWCRESLAHSNLLTTVLQSTPANLTCLVSCRVRIASPSRPAD